MLFLVLQTRNHDADGNLTGFTQIYADTNLSPYGTFTLDASRLTGATMSATDVPVSVYQLALDGTVISVVPGTTDVAATWTGVGPVTRSGYTVRDVTQGFVTIVHSTDLSRDATAVGSIANVPMNAEDLIWGRSRTRGPEASP